jgi:riboflavin kinase / FMN adenylyltransferase
LKVYNSIEEFKGIKTPVVTTGTFDGVHIGHRKIIKRLNEIAGKCSGETVLLTFYPHPRMILSPDDRSLKLLNTQEEKIGLLEKAGVDHLIIHPFTKEFSKLPSDDFIRDILVKKIGTQKLVIGYNHHFGRNREGSFANLKFLGPVYGFDVEEIPALDIDHVEVSSTKIRNGLEAGDIETANKYLGYEYFISGIVIEGKKLGKGLGYPTANIDVGNKYKLIPADGIYAVKVNYQEKEFKGMMSIGMNPTVDGKNKTIEVHIFNFNKEIYGEQIQVSFVKKIRDEIKFDSLEALKSKMKEDENISLEILK